ncbi:MAG: hypothetical protein Fur0032_18400 [Terrimicrobiaceae bacterium]
MTGRLEILFTNRQRREKLVAPRVLRRWVRALPAVFEASLQGAVLFELEAVEITLVSDRVIGKIHAQFFDDPSPTDVITFDHGEIILGAETIAANASEFGLTFEEEVVLCGIHGLLHLGGWEDEAEREAAEMARLQEAILVETRHADS